MLSSRTPVFRIALAVAAGGAALALAGCETTSPSQVTRFHLAQPIAPGTFSVETGPMIGQGSPLAPDSLELQSYNQAVAAELGRIGFTPGTDLASSEYSVSVSVDRGTRPDMRPHGASVSLGIGGASFGGGGRRGGGGFGVGGGVGTTVPVGGNQERFIIGTRMMVQIKRRSEGTVVWEGRAMTEAPASGPDASPSVAVAKLAHAMFTGFPGESGRTITVK